MSVWDERFRRIVEEDPEFKEILGDLQQQVYFLQATVKALADQLEKCQERNK